MADPHCTPPVWVVREPVPGYTTPSNIRMLKVRAGHYVYQRVPRPVPWIYLKGYWLEQAGFTIGTSVHVTVSDGQIVLTLEAPSEPVIHDHDHHGL